MRQNVKSSNVSSRQGGRPVINVNDQVRHGNNVTRLTLPTPGQPERQQLVQ